jgi:hypothetical protein
MTVCDCCKKSFDERLRLPVERSVLCGMDCMDEVVDRMLKEVADHGQRTATAFSQDQCFPKL